MKICVTNHFETNLEAQAYFACLNVNRPLIVPDSNEPPPVCVIVPEDQHKVCISTSFLFSGLSSFEVVSSSSRTLIYDLTQAFLTSKTTLVFVTLRFESQPCAIWVFAQGVLKAAIPFATKASVLISKSSYIPSVTPEALALDFLSDYLNYLRREKSIFVLEELKEEAVIMAATIRHMTGSQLIYGKAHAYAQKKVLKTFDFLTHDLPGGTPIDLGALYTKLAPILDHMMESQILPAKLSQQIKLWKKGSLWE
ncbi:MAG: hypothetical protein WCI18_08425 [Pseudomonadota bacterium]